MGVDLGEQYHNLVSRPFPLISEGQQAIYLRYVWDSQSNVSASQWRVL